MANQITIDIGAAANDGTGDPLRTAFNYVNNNFSNVWNTGLPNSNVQFSDNRILTVNTNANLVLAPNGIAKVVSNVSVLPNMSNVHSIGSSDRRWNTLYAQYLDISNDITFGDLTVDGNLTVTGNIIEIGNIVTDSKTIQLANTAGTANAANGSGITVGASDNIATLLYNSTSNTWTTNIGVSVTGNVTGNYIIGNGALLTGLAATYGNANVAAYLPTYTGNLSAGNASVTNVVAAQNITATTGTFTGDQFSDGAMYVGSPAGTVLGSDVVMQITANSGSYSQTNFQNINPGVTASSDYILTADNGNNITHYLDLGITSSGWDGSETNVLANLVANNGYLYVQDGNLTVGTRNGNVSYGWNFDTTGNLTVPGNIIPRGNNTQSLGSATRQWNDLYLSNATIYMNNVPISLTAGNVLTVNGDNVVTSDGNGNIDINNITSTSNVSIETSAELVTISVGVSDWVFDETGVLTAPGEIETVGNISAGYFLGNGSQLTGIVSSYGNSNVATYLPTYTGNIGAGNIVFTDSYSYNGNGFVSSQSTSGILKSFDWKFSDNTLGNDTITLQWNLLDTTLGQWYISTDAQGNLWTLDSETKKLSFGTTGSPGGGTVTFGTAAANNAGGINDIELTSTNSNVYVRANGNSWQFGKTGLLTTPGGINLNYNGNVSGLIAAAPAYASFTSAAGKQLIIGSDNGNKYWTFGSTGDLTLPGNYTIGPSGSSLLIAAPDTTDSIYLDWNSTVSMVIGNSGASDVVQITNNGEVWGFYDDGALILPTGATIANDGFNGSASSVISLNSLSPDGNTVSFQAQGNTSNAVIQTYANATTTTYNWTFDNTGVLTVAGNIVMPPGASLLGTGASPSPNISGFNSASFGADVTATGNITGGNLRALTNLYVEATNGNLVLGDATATASPGLSSTNSITVTANRAGTPKEWVFTTVGDFAGSGNISGGNISAAGNIATSWLDIGNIGNIASLQADALFQIVTDAGNTAPYWTFNSDGNLFVPGTIAGKNVTPLIIDGNGSGTEGYISLPASNFGGEQIAIVNQFSLGNGIRLQTNGGNLFFSDAGELTAPGNITTTGNITGGNITTAGNISGNTAGYAIGYRDIPQVSFTGNATIATTDAGKHFYSTQSTSYILTIANNASQGFQVGAAITIVNQGTGNITIAQGSGVTLYVAGNATSGNRTVSTFGMATLIKVATDTWFVSGVGVA